MLGKFVWKKQANIKKGKGKKKKKKETKLMFSKKLLMDNKKYKNGLLKRKTKAKKNKIGRNETL